MWEPKGWIKETGMSLATQEKKHYLHKKCLEETQTLRTGCSKAESRNFCPAADA